MIQPLSYLRKYIIAGLLIWVPLGITILVIKLLIDLLDRSMLLLPPPLRPENLLGFPVPGLGILISAVVIVSTGFIVTNIAGRKMVSLGEELVERIPLVRSIYSAVKQVTHTILSSDRNSFRQVLLIQYPRKGVWTMAFQTGDTIEAFNEITGENLLTVFVPTTPNPTSGFIIMVPAEEVIKLDIDVESALKFVMSLGVVTPGKRSEILSEINKIKIPATEKN